MRKLAQWWNRQHGVLRWTVGIVATLVFYAIAYGLVAAVLGLDADDDDMTIRLSVLVVALPLFGVGVLVQRRRLGGKGQLSLYRRAYRTGVVPDGADVEKWRPVVRKQLRFFREGRKVQLGFWIVLATLVLVGFVVLLVSADDYRLGAIVFVAVMAAVMVPTVWGLNRLYRWRERQFARLEKALEQRPTEPAA